MFFMLNTKVFYTVVARAILSRKIYKQGQWEGKKWRKGKGKRRRRAEKWGIIIIIAHTTMTTTYGGDGESKSAGTLFVHLSDVVGHSLLIQLMLIWSLYESPSFHMISFYGFGRPPHMLGCLCCVSWLLCWSWRNGALFVV